MTPLSFSSARALLSLSTARPRPAAATRLLSPPPARRSLLFRNAKCSPTLSVNDAEAGPQRQLEPIPATYPTTFSPIRVSGSNGPPVVVVQQRLLRLLTLLTVTAVCSVLLNAALVAWLVMRGPGPPAVPALLSHVAPGP